jgi:membrane-bound metal-dependent hydrolase YbcI (DUF457 family)
MAFIVFVLLTSRLPDVDLWLQALGLPVKHHGVTHTVVFVLGFAVVVGAVLTAVFRPVLRRWWRMTEGEDVNRETIYAFVSGGLALGGLSHLLADALAADWAEPIEPFWPVIQTSVEIGVVSYDSMWANLGLFAVAIGLHLPIFISEITPLETRFMNWTVELPNVEDQE